MRILNSIQTCRNIVRYYAPVTRALSVTNQTAEAVVSSAAQFAATTTETLRNSIHSIDQFKRSQRSLRFGPNEQKKIKFLMRHSDFFTQVNDLTQSEVQAQVKASNLELTGLPHDIILLEEKLNEQLCNVEILNFRLALQVGAILGFHSPKQLISKLRTAPNVLVQLSYDHLSDKALVTATGIKGDVKAFQKELQSMIDSVLSNDIVVPEYLLSSKDFSNLYLELNELPDTIVSVRHGAVNVWTNHASNLLRVQEELDKFIDTATSSNQFAESASLSNLKVHYIFGILKHKLSNQVDINYKSYDGNISTMEVRGIRSEVKKTVAEVQKLSKGIQSATVILPPQGVKALGDLTSFFGSMGKNLHVLKPTMENPTIVLTGGESQVNAILLKIYNCLEAKCSAENFSMIDTSLFFTYLNYEELKYDEKNLQLFCTTFPEAAIEWKTKPDGSIHMKIRSSPSDLNFMNNILKWNRIIPCSSSKDAAAVSPIASVLQQNGKLGDQVTIEEKADHIVINAYKDHLVAACEDIHNIIDTQGYQHKRYATNRTLLVPGNLLDDIKSAADAYEVLVAFSSDPSKESKLIIDIIGRAGNCDIFKTYLDMKLSSLTRLDLTSTNTSSLASRILQSNEEKGNDAFLLHYPELNDYWIGGEHEAVDSIENFVTDNFLEESVSYGDERMSDYLRDQIDRLTAEFPTVDISINGDESEIQITGAHTDAREVTDKISDIVSKCGVFEGMFDSNTYGNGGRYFVFRTILPNESSMLDDKVSLKLLYDDEKDQVKLQMVGKKLSVKNMVDQLNKMGSLINGEEDYCKRSIELPYSGLYYLNYLQTKLGVPNVVFESNSFGIHSLWAPLVRCRKLWNWKTLYKTPERRNWKMFLTGGEQHVRETETIIKNTMNDMNFHRIKFKTDDMKHGIIALTGSDFVQSAVADGEVKFYVEFYDKKTKECYVNVFGDDGEKVNDLVSKIETFISNGVKTVYIHTHDYVDRAFPVKNCFYNSRILEQLDECREKVYWFFNKDTHKIILAGDQNLVVEFEEKIVEWLESLTKKTKVYSYRDQDFWGTKVKFVPYHQYCKQRWHRLVFEFGRRNGQIHYGGTREDVDEFEEYLSNEVRRTLHISSINEFGQTTTALISNITVLFRGVFIKMEQSKLVLFGEKSEVADVMAILKEKEATGNDDIKNFAFKLRIEDKVVEVPYHDVARAVVSVKFNQYWPNLQFFITGREINFVGPQKDIDECSNILANMATWKVPNTLMRSATLFRDHRSREGTFRDSHFIPPELLDKLFIDRAKGLNRSGQVTLWGRPEDIHPLSYYIEKVLPRMQLTRKSIPLTLQQVLFLRSPHGWRVMFSQLEDTVAYSFAESFNSVEIVGDSDSVSQIMTALEKFTTENWAVYEFPPGSEKEYWNVRLSDWAKRDFPRMLFDDHSRSVFGHNSDVNSFEKMWSNQVTKGSKLNMTEQDVWNISLGSIVNNISRTAL